MVTGEEGKAAETPKATLAGRGGSRNGREIWWSRLEQSYESARVLYYLAVATSSMNQSRTLTATQTSTDALYAGTLFLRADGTTPDHTTQPPHHEQGQRSAARLREEEEARRIAEETVDPGELGGA